MSNMSLFWDRIKVDNKSPSGFSYTGVNAVRGRRKQEGDVAGHFVEGKGYLLCLTEDGIEYKYVLHRVMYELIHDIKLTRKDVVIVVDGDYSNMDESNLLLISRSDVVSKGMLKMHKRKRGV